MIFSLQDIGNICEQLTALKALNLSNNLMTKDISGMPPLKNIRTLVLNNTRVNWTQVSVVAPVLSTVQALLVLKLKCTAFDMAG